MTEGVDLDGLKACPFCGCKVKLVEREHRDDFMGRRTWYHIEGKHEGIGGVCPGQVRARGSAETAIAAWNTRAAPAEAELRAEVGRLKRVIKKLERKLAIADPDAPYPDDLSAIAGEPTALTTAMLTTGKKGFAP